MESRATEVVNSWFEEDPLRAQNLLVRRMNHNDPASHSALSLAYSGKLRYFLSTDCVRYKSYQLWYGGVPSLLGPCSMMCFIPNLFVHRSRKTYRDFVTREKARIEMEKHFVCYEAFWNKTVVETFPPCLVSDLLFFQLPSRQIHLPCSILSDPRCVVMLCRGSRLGARQNKHM